MPSCIVCSKRTQRDGVTLHVFPRGVGRENHLKLWKSFAGKSEDWNPGSSVICSNHFVLDDFEEGGRDGRKKLKKTAVPILLPDDEEDQHNKCMYS
jgi:hypothetical protein